MDSPLGEARELYRVALEGSGGRVELETAVPHVVLDATQVASVGIGSATLTIRQLGDLAASRAAAVPVTLS